MQLSNGIMTYCSIWCGLLLLLASSQMQQAEGWMIPAPPTAHHQQRHLAKILGTGPYRIDRHVQHTVPSSPTQLDAGVDDEIVMMSSGPFIVGAALILGIAAQGWINNLAKGERGLGAYLSDGGGFSGSGFSDKANRDNDAVSGDDPLPWLKLPKLDFVDVAGQEDSVEVQLESIRRKMNAALEEGQFEQATEIRKELEEIMTANGFDFTPE